MFLNYFLVKVKTKLSLFLILNYGQPNIDENLYLTDQNIAKKLKKPIACHHLLIFFVAVHYSFEIKKTQTIPPRNTKQFWILLNVLGNA